MAVYFLYVKIFTRSKGNRVTKAAAYRSGEFIADDRSGDRYNYTHREDVADKDIVLPSGFAGRTDANWARERATLWNAVEHSDRRNARLAREILVALPPELSRVQRSKMVRRFSQELADRYQNAVDFAIHLPKTGSDQRHHHAHLLLTTRKITAQGLGERTTLELGGRERHARGIGPSVEDLGFMRRRWAEVTNEAFKDAGLNERVDHRSYKDQGINREPTPMMPQKMYYQEKVSGVPGAAGEQFRARHRERIEARAQGAAVLARIIEKQKQEAHQQALDRIKRNASAPKKVPRAALTREELLEKRREYRRTHREEINLKKREWVSANRAEVNRKKREWHQAHTPQKAATPTLTRAEEVAKGRQATEMRRSGGNDLGM
jgi:hypothetical protein